jgi:hypothetical protein
VPKRVGEKIELTARPGNKPLAHLTRHASRASSDPGLPRLRRETTGIRGAPFIQTSDRLRYSRWIAVTGGLQGPVLHRESESGVSTLVLVPPKGSKRRPSLTAPRPAAQPSQARAWSCFRSRASSPDQTCQVCEEAGVDG